MRYTAYLNNSLFFDSSSTTEALNLVAGKLTLEQGSAGTLVFRIAPSNPIYNADLTIADWVRVYKDVIENGQTVRKLLFTGRVASRRELMNTIVEIKCEGLLAILNDTIVRPATYNCMLPELVDEFITSHNEQVGADKQIVAGTVNAYDGYLYRAYENYESTWKRLSDLKQTYGGYLSLAEAGGELVLDFKIDDPELATQEINFGENLLDINIEGSMTDVITCLIPLGAEIEQEDGTKKRLTINSVNSNSDTLVSNNAATYGRITGIHIWDDVTVAGNLKTKGQEYLAANDHPVLSVSVTALDLANVDANIESFSVGDLVKVTSSRHGIAGTFAFRRQEIDFINPANNKLKLGELVGSLTQYYSNSQAKTNSDVEKIISDYVTGETLENALIETQTEYMSAIEQSASEITSNVTATISAQNEIIETLSTTINQNAEAVEIWINDFEEHIIFDVNGITIRGANGSPVYSQQDEDSYGFYDQNGTPLLEITPEGLTATTVETDAQFILSDGDYREWAIRKGAVSGSKHNLNIAWIGG